MTIDTLGYTKRLEAAGFNRQQAEAHAEALRDELVPQLATSTDLDKMASRIETAVARVETALWKHTAGIILAVLAVGSFVARFAQ